MYILIPVIVIAFIVATVLICRKKRGERERFHSAYKESVLKADKEVTSPLNAPKDKE